MGEDQKRDEARDALLEVLHELHPRIRNLKVGDCHCNLLAEVALDALDIPTRYEVAYRAGYGQGRDDEAAGRGLPDWSGEG